MFRLYFGRDFLDWRGDLKGKKLSERTKHCPLAHPPPPTHTHTF